MKYFLLFIIFVIVKNIVEPCKTVDDVLLNFQPVFDEIHSSISDLQSITHAEGSRQAETIRNCITQSTSENQNDLQSARYDIKWQIRTILSETEMNKQEDMVTHCHNKEKMALKIFIRESRAGTNVCRQLGFKAIDNLRINVRTYYKQQGSWHYRVESTKTSKQRCGKIDAPFEMQTCLIKYLYLLEKPFVEKIAPLELNDFIKRNDEFVARVLTELNICFSIVSEKTMTDRLAIIDELKACVFEAAEVDNYKKTFKRI